MLNLLGKDPSAPALGFLPISRNQLFHAGLGLLGAGASGSRNPYAAGLAGLNAGAEQDALRQRSQREKVLFDQDQEDRRLKAEARARVTGMLSPTTTASVPGQGTRGLTPLTHLDRIMINGGLRGGRSMAEIAATPGINPDAEQPKGLGLKPPPGGLLALSSLGSPKRGAPAQTAAAGTLPTAAGQLGAGPGQFTAGATTEVGIAGAPQAPNAMQQFLAENPHVAQVAQAYAQFDAEKALDYVTGEMQRAQTPAKRQIYTDALGYARDAVTNERLNPGLEVPPEAQSQIAKIYQDIEKGTIPRDVGMARIAKLNQPSQGITVNNMGNIPTGWQLVTDERTNTQRMEPIPGGPADQKQQQQQAAADAAKSNQKVKSDIVTEDLDRIFSLVQESPGTTTGVGGAALSWLPGTAAHDISRISDTIKANLAFDKLNALRQASPTGGALGSVSAPELDLLKADIANLEQSQTQEQFLHALTRVKREYTRTVHGDEAAARVKPYKITREQAAATNTGQPTGGNSPSSPAFQLSAQSTAGTELEGTWEGFVRQSKLSGQPASHLATQALAQQYGVSNVQGDTMIVGNLPLRLKDLVKTAREEKTTIGGVIEAFKAQQFQVEGQAGEITAR